MTLELNGVSILFIDTPGLAWQPSEDARPEEKERRRGQDVLLRNKGRIDRLKDPLPAVSYIVSRAETEDLMVFYSLPAFAKGDVDAFLMGVARAQGLIKKVSQVPISRIHRQPLVYLNIHFFLYSQGGKLDLAAAARIVLRDWSTGKLSRYAVPPAVSGPGTAAKADADAVSLALVTIYEGDAALLEKLPSRKEMRRTRDLVRLSSERVDDRTLALDAPWFSTEDGADGVSDSDVDDDEDASELESEAKAEEIGSDADADGGDSEEDADDAGLGLGEWLDKSVSEEDESSSARKRKRPQPQPPSSLAPSSKSQSGPTRPRKKVAFATSVKAITTTTDSTRPSSSSKDHTLSRPSTTTRPSSPYKKSNTVKAPAGTKPRTRKSAANAPPPTAKKRKPEAGAQGEDDTYDFGKFF